MYTFGTIDRGNTSRINDDHDRDHLHRASAAVTAAAATTTTMNLDS